MFLEVFISSKLEKLEFKYEKNLGFRNTQEKLELENVFDDDNIGNISQLNLALSAFG